MRQLTLDHGLSLALALLFLRSWLVQSVAGWVEFAHDQAAALFGQDGYVWSWPCARCACWTGTTAAT